MVFSLFLSYQLALTTPVSSPASALSRNCIRDRPNLRRLPRGRPVIAQRSVTRIGFASRGCLPSFTCASARASAVRAGFLMIALSSLRRAEYFATVALRRSFFKTEDVFAMDGFLQKIGRRPLHTIA